MEYANVLTEIKKGRIRPVYLLHGDETYLARQVEKTIIDAVLAPDERDTGLAVLEHDPASSYLVGLIETAPFFGGKNVIIVRECSLLKAKKGSAESAGEEEKSNNDSGDSRLIEIIGNMPEYSLVIFTVDGKADKRKKLYKAVEQNGAAIETASPKAKDARIWVTEKLGQLNKRMAPDAMEYYLEVLSMMPKISVALIHNELDKIALYTGSANTIQLKDLHEIMAAIPEVNVFEMTEALSRRDIKPALELLNAQLSAGEHPVKILGLLAFQVRRLWQIKELADAGKNVKDIAEVLKIHSFIAERLFRQSKSFRTDRLKQAMLELAWADRALKSGRANSSILEKIMIELCI